MKSNMRRNVNSSRDAKSVFEVPTNELRNNILSYSMEKNMVNRNKEKSLFINYWAI